MILSLSLITSGTIEIFDSKPKKQNYSRIGSLIESPALLQDKSAKENIELFSTLFKAKQNLDLLKTVGLDHVGSKKVKDFSLGMKQRLGIGIALIGNPDFLILYFFLNIGSRIE